MATITQNYKPNALRTVLIHKRDDLIEKLIPQRRTVVSVGMILAGISVPVLMAAHLLPVTLFLGFVSLALIAVGSTLVLFYSGEL